MIYLFLNISCFMIYINIFKYIEKYRKQKPCGHLVIFEKSNPQHESSKKFFLCKVSKTIAENDFELVQTISGRWERQSLTHVPLLERKLSIVNLVYLDVWCAWCVPIMSLMCAHTFLTLPS